MVENSVQPKDSQLCELSGSFLYVILREELYEIGMTVSLYMYTT